MTMNKGKDGRVAAENLKGSKVPRKAGLTDETSGKGVGTRDIRNVGGPRFNFSRKSGR
jgi:hypothetical protein